MFSFYVLEDFIEFGAIGKTPYKTINTFHSQFVLDYDLYKDNNNYVKFNRAYTTETKNPITAEIVEYSFLNHYAKPDWTGNRFKWTENITDDGG